jgi:hypothetical protein
MARQALKCCGEECEDLRILPRRINYFEAKEIVGNGQSLLPLSPPQPAAVVRAASRLVTPKRQHTAKVQATLVPRLFRRPLWTNDFAASGNQ